MAVKPVLLWSDALLWLLLAAVLAVAWVAWRSEPQRARWRRVGADPVGMASATLLAVFLVIGVLDSLHYRLPLPPKPGVPTSYSVEVVSVFDGLLQPLKANTEKTYSAPLATHLFSKEMREGEQGMDYPRLKYGGRHLGEQLDRHGSDLAQRVVLGLLAACALSALLLLALRKQVRAARSAQRGFAWPAVLATITALALLAGPVFALATGYHVLGTDKVGQDVLYLALKSIRTGLLIGTLTTLVMLPISVLLGILAGYAGGWVDDLIQYIYITLNSIPGVLLIAAAVLMMQVVIDTHPDWFATAAERADARLLALCAILGMTSWTGLARLLRGETLKLRELDYVQAAKSFGVSTLGIMLRHILPNLMHIVLIAVVMDFSGLVLAEAVLSYVGIGVDPGTISFGTMINAARMELAREPTVWWSLAAAFVFMF
ncbi:MAG TPA: ABC transporter permease, partial [Rhodocyclaceae bacterium]